MNTYRNEPADTRSMGIVHSALRRDLRRTRMVLDDPPPPPDDSRRRGDRRARPLDVPFPAPAPRRGGGRRTVAVDPGARPVGRCAARSDGADHARIAPALAAVEEAAQAYGDDPSARERLLTTLSASTTCCCRTCAARNSR